MCVVPLYLITLGTSVNRYLYSNLDLHKTTDYDTINRLPALLPPMENDDVLDFAKYLGLDGADAEMYYESYYNIEYDYDAELAMEAYYESVE